MGKVITIADFLLQKSVTLEDRNAILEIAVLPEAEAIIEAAGLMPLHFHLNQDSERTFKQKPITYREPDDSFSDIYYDAKTEDAVYRVECKVFIDLTEVTVQTTLFKLENYQSGNREWLYYENSGWSLGPGEDYFELNEFLL